MDLVIEHRCKLCNEKISEEEVSGAIIFDLWEKYRIGESTWETIHFRSRSGEEEVFTQENPPEDADCGVQWDDRWRWVHMACKYAYGSGLTSAQWSEKMNNIGRLLIKKKDNPEENDD